MHDFKVGDLVIKNPDSGYTSNIRDGAIYMIGQVNSSISVTIYGGDLEERNVIGGGSRQQGLRDRVGPHIWNISPTRLKHAGECYQCIRDCKLDKKCIFYEEG